MSGTLVAALAVESLVRPEELIPPARIRDYLGDQVDALPDAQQKAWWTRLELPDAPPTDWTSD